MKFLLDTNVVSEPFKPKPNPNVIRWLAAVDEDRTFISVVTLAELRAGVERLAAGFKRKRLEEWLEDELQVRFEARTLPVDPAVADLCGRIIARSQDMGRPIEAMDAFIAATAVAHDLTLVTHNVSDFQGVLKPIVDPWIIE